MKISSLNLPSQWAVAIVEVLLFFTGCENDESSNAVSMVEYCDSNMSVSDESNDKMPARHGSDSPSDDASSRGNVRANAHLKKGPWTSVEDAILVDYVNKHGEGNWNAVQKHTGLARCGKSCRLRWANHLKPDLKKCPISQEEENLIIELHAKMGNKWARMANELPGRTDNEIKNFWNTRIKRRQRAGLPIYPPEICSRALNENQHKDDTCAGDVHYPDFIPINNFEIPSVEFKRLELNQQVYSPPFHDIPGTLLDVPANSLLGQGYDSSYSNKSLLSTMYPSKRLRGSQSFYPASSQYPNVSYMPNAQSFMYTSTYDHNLTSYQPSPSCVIDGNQYKNAVLNGNPSSSEPNGTMKPELPSNQTTQVENWGSPPSPLPPLESVDSLIQTPPTDHTQLCHLSPQNNGLLDAVLHESQALRNPRSCCKSSQVIRETEWDSCWELTSPLGHSSSFSEDTTLISGNAFDESEAIEPIPGFRVKEEATIWDPMRYEDRDELTKMLSRPDLLLAHDSWKKRARQEPWPYE